MEIVQIRLKNQGLFLPKLFLVQSQLHISPVTGILLTWTA